MRIFILLFCCKIKHRLVCAIYPSKQIELSYTRINISGSHHIAMYLSCHDNWFIHSIIESDMTRYGNPSAGKLHPHFMNR